MKQITLIGNGNMATSMIAQLSSSFQITVVGRNQDKLAKLKNEFPNINTASLFQYDISAQNVILCVKPYALQAVADTLKGTANCLFSILVGTKISTLSCINASHYYRIMPNVGAKYAHSITAIYSQSDTKIAEEIFSFVGSVVVADSEAEIDMAAALCSSAVAFLALVADSLSDGAVKEGMNREKSMQYLSGLFDSFSSLLQNNVSPYDIKNSVMSPAGTTIAGYSELEKGAVRSSFIDAIGKSCQRAKQISS